MSDAEPLRGTILRDALIPFDELEAFYRRADGVIPDYSNASLPRWHRILHSLKWNEKLLQGPILDVASGKGILFEPLKKYFPALFPYEVTELKAQSLELGGDPIPVHQFQCEEGRLDVPDMHFGVTLFCDIIEHLLVDPIWAMLEMNRTMKMGGHLVISTPNVGGLDRITRILQGINPNTEHQYKPTDLYQRHNREWTVTELSVALHVTGFKTTWLNTFPDLMSDFEKQLLTFFKDNKITNIEESLFGPQILFIAEKIEHKTLDDEHTIDERWPSLLYTGFDGYRKRPEVFPIR